MRKRKAPPIVVGWREMVGLPELGVAAIKAKVDTGARTSAIHATRVRRETKDGADWVHLSLGDASGPPPHEDGPPVVQAVRAAVRDDVPVFAAGGIWTREDAERALEAGADVVVVGRAAIIHPDWPRVSGRDGWTPHRPPWTEDALRKAAVGTALIDYLGRFAGLVEGGEEPR